MDEKIIGMQDFWDSPAGRYLKAWETAEMETLVSDVFGFHALQLGLPELDALAANRMPHRWCAVQNPVDVAQGAKVGQAQLVCEPSALPFPEASLDLVVMPHTLELHPDPHAVLREAARVLVPEGRVVICSLNPNSLWGWRYRSSAPKSGLVLPQVQELIGYWRLRDWLKLLDFEIERGGFGCYLPQLSQEDWMRRLNFMDRLGPKWWPILGAVYFVTAVKRVHGMRLIEPKRQKVRKTAAVRLPVANKHPTPERRSTRT